LAAFALALSSYRLRDRLFCRCRLIRQRSVVLCASCGHGSRRRRARGQFAWIEQLLVLTRDADLDVLHHLLRLFVHDHRQDHRGQSGNRHRANQAATCLLLEV
jgi:hypothetical protein